MEQGHVAAVILAAGASRRMKGRDKLLEQVGGRPLLRKVAEAALGSRARPVLAVLPPAQAAGGAARRRVLAGLSLRIVDNPAAERGMGTSLAAGVAALEDADAVAGLLVLLADMPLIGAAGIDRLIAAFLRDPARPVRAAAGGRPGNPVILPARLFPALRKLADDRGARDLLRAEGKAVRLVDLPGDAALCDLDTPADWVRFRGAPMRTGQAAGALPPDTGPTRA